MATDKKGKLAGLGTLSVKTNKSKDKRPGSRHRPLITSTNLWVVVEGGLFPRIIGPFKSKSWATRVRNQLHQGQVARLWRK